MKEFEQELERIGVWFCAQVIRFARRTPMAKIESEKEKESWADKAAIVIIEKIQKIVAPKAASSKPQPAK